jgi:two-component system response regulator HydG
MPQAQRRVLVVDDLPEIARFFEALGKRMAPFDVTVDTQTDGRRALDMIAKVRYDLVVSDFRLGEVDGLDVLTCARRASPKARRVLMTGYNEVPATMERILEARVDAYMQKPLQAQDVMLLLLELLTGNESTLNACRARARELESIGTREERMV